MDNLIKEYVDDEYALVYNWQTNCIPDGLREHEDYVDNLSAMTYSDVKKINNIFNGFAERYNIEGFKGLDSLDLCRYDNYHEYYEVESKFVEYRINSAVTFMNGGASR